MAASRAAQRDGSVDLSGTTEPFPDYDSRGTMRHSNVFRRFSAAWAREVVESTHRRISVTRRPPPRREPEALGLRCCQDPYRDSLPSLGSQRAL